MVLFYGPETESHRLRLLGRMLPGHVNAQGNVSTFGEILAELIAPCCEAVHGPGIHGLVVSEELH
jgi:hypothetical protein